MAELVLTTEQTMRALARLEPSAPLTYKQLRDLEARQCVVPRALAGGRSPRVYGLGDLMLLRLVSRLQAEPLLARWQGWSVVAQLRPTLMSALLGTLRRVLVVQGAFGLILRPREAAQYSGVAFDLTDCSRGVREAMRAEVGEVWNGAQWVGARVAAAAARPVPLSVVPSG